MLIQCEPTGNKIAADMNGATTTMHGYGLDWTNKIKARFHVTDITQIKKPVV